MATLSDAQIAAYAKQAGWTGTDLEIAVGVALAESSGRTDVVNYLGCVGLWQVYQKVHAARHPLWTTEWLKQPANNALAAYQIWKDAGNSWRPWTTYTSGSWRRFQSRARTAVGTADGADATAGLLDDAGRLIAGPITGPLIGNGMDALSGVNDFLTKLQDPKMQQRILFVIIGVILILIGLIAMSRATDRIGQVAKIATDVVPQAKAVKVAAKAGKVVRTAQTVTGKHGVKSEVKTWKRTS